MFADSPCFLWWPKDILADARVQTLTLEQEGAYRRLIDYCWIEGSIPSDPAELGMLCKIDTSTQEGLERAEGLRNRLEPFFIDAAERPGWWAHRRVEEQRREQREERDARAAKEAAERERLSQAGKKGAERAWEGRRRRGKAGKGVNGRDEP